MSFVIAKNKLKQYIPEGGGAPRHPRGRREYRRERF